MNMSMIFARRIPSGLGTVRAHTVRGGMGADADYGAAYTPAAGAACAAGYAKNQYGYCVKSGASATTPGVVDSFLSAMFPKPTPATASPAAALPAYQPAGGMSTNTMIAIGLGAAGLLAIVMLSRK
jgi:hypothetical protein